MSCCPTCGNPTPDAHGLVVDQDARTVSRNGVVLRLPPQELSIFAFLAKRFGKNVNKYDITDNLYQLKPECDHPEDPEALLKVRIVHLRKKVGALGLRIITAWGFGYRLEVAQ